MDDLVEEFIAETRETLEALAGEIVAWERDPNDRARLDAIFRFVHTVKGSCGFLDLPRLARLSHAAEDGLQAAREGRRVPDRPFVDAVLAIIDRIGELTEAIAQGSALDDSGDGDLIAALDGDARSVPCAATPAAERRAPSRSVRLGVELLDRMMAGMSDLVLVRNELARRVRDAGADPEIEVALQRLSGTVAELRDSVTRMRMQRVEALFAGLPRMVRDLAAELGKSVTLSIDGGDVELDREMIEMIRDPIAHILRNAIDHGIETPAERELAGKPANGRVRVSARQVGNQIEIRVCDDGRGIDTNALAAQAEAAGVLTRGDAARMSEPERRALMFRPGVSTAKAISQVSGRGVGMDVVRANVERIGGTVTLEGAWGRGVDVIIRVPLTLSIITAISVVAGGHCFAVPRSAIEEIVGNANQTQIGDAAIMRLRGETLPHVALSDVLGLGADGEQSNIHIIMATAAGRFALGVDAIGEQEELVIKPAAPMVMVSGCYAGETLPDSGKPMLVLDVGGIATRAGVVFDRGPQAADAHATPPAATTSTLLFRGIDGVRKGIALAAVDRILPLDPGAIAVIGETQHAVIDGAIVPLAGGCPKPGATAEIIRLCDGATSIGLAIGKALDIVELPVELAPPPAGSDLLGVALVEGEAIGIFAPFALFARHGAPVPVERRRCALVADGEGWMATMLKPLIEAAGYDAVLVADADGAEGVVIALDVAAPVSLRRDAAPRDAADASIYRYDRAGVIAAIERVAAGAGR